MPDKPLQPCRYPRCPAYRVDGSGYCVRHADARPAWHEARDGEYGYLASNTNRTFRRLRSAYLMRHPLCSTCGEPGEVLDHVVAHRGDLGLFWSQENWQTLCVACHNRKTAREARGVSRVSQSSDGFILIPRRVGP